MFSKFRRIAVKLAILAGVPVIGAMLLSAHITREARERARSAEGMGSIEDLAELSSRMTETLSELQSERALAALAAGFESPETQALQAQRRKTDQAVAEMDRLLKSHDSSRLPVAIGKDLGRVHGLLQELGSRRREIASSRANINDVLRIYGEVNDALIHASGSLTHLSDDGELLRALSALVSTMQVKERGSREHAVLNHAFAHNEFAPGLYRYLVTLVTEEAVYVESLKTFVSEEEAGLFETALRHEAVERAAAMRKTALETTEDELNVDARAWYEAQRQKITLLGQLERELAHRARSVARSKMASIEAAVTYSRNLVVAVVAASLLLAWIVGRRISRSVLGLANVAGRVQKEQDFSLRAEKSSQDEVGLLTDAFNDMLAGIQRRDGELQAHRENLEALVQERTRELEKRNRDLRLVLDTVDQGLVVLQPTGAIAGERSRMFDEFFGAAHAGEPYYHHLGGADEALGERLKLDWEQLSDGFMPLELLLAQSLSRFERNGRHYSLAYKPLFKGEHFDGALLMVSDVTGEVAARKAEAEQREQVATIAHVLRDRAGFQEFFRESRRLLEQIRADRFVDPADRMRAVHTLKGNAALFQVTSVAEAAHTLEQASIDGEEGRVLALASALEHRWGQFAARIEPFLGEDTEDRFELTRTEFEQLSTAARPYPAVDGLVQRIAHEPLRTRFLRFAEQLRQLAKRLGKSDVDVLVHDGGVRVPGPRFAQFWAVFAHVVRNVADHGLQTAHERARMGKPEKNRVEFKAKCVDANLVVEVVDDGRGIDWNRVCEQAQSLGLEHRTREQQVAALFSDGFSMARNVSSTSGRGIGLSAILRACQTLGGTCTLESEPGQGVRLTLSLPLTEECLRGPWPRLSVEPTAEPPRRSSAGSA